MNRHARGFTLIELLIVITIIMILVGMLIPAISAVRRMQKTATTEAHLEGIRSAVDNYLKNHAVLGDEDAQGTWTVHDYLDLFVHRQSAALLELSPSGVLRNTSGDDAGPYSPVDHVKYGTHMKDAWGDPITVQIINEAMPGLAHRTHTTQVLIRCTRGTPGDSPKAIQDDIVYRVILWDEANQTKRPWEKVLLTEVASDGSFSVEKK